MDRKTTQVTDVECYAEVDELLAEQLDAIYAEADLFIDEYYRRWGPLVEDAKANKTKPGMYVPKLSYRDRRRLTLEWWRYTGRRAPARKGQVGKAIREYIRKGRRHRYDIRRFAQEPVWQLELVKEFEDRFHPLRKRVAAINEVRAVVARQLTLARREAAQFDEEGGLDNDS